MKLNYVKSQSTVRPPIIDDTSSKTSVYIRKNIVENTVHLDNNDDEEYVIYDYDEAILTKEEYRQYCEEMAIMDIEQIRADLDYLSIMMDVNLSEGSV